MKGLHPTHDHSALGLLLLVVRLMTHGDLLLLDFSSEFSVDMKAGAGVVQGVVLKDPAHVVEQAGGRQHDGGRMEGVCRSRRSKEAEWRPDISVGWNGANFATTT